MTERTSKQSGYVFIGRQLAHVLIAERALGKKLPKGSCVHHVNEIKSDNTNSNLVICENTAYHRLLHYRTKAYDITGNADFVQCVYCKTWSDPTHPEIVFYEYGIKSTKRSTFHRGCVRTAKRAASKKRYRELLTTGRCGRCGKDRQPGGTNTTCRPCVLFLE